MGPPGHRMAGSDQVMSARAALPAELQIKLQDLSKAFKDSCSRVNCGTQGYCPRKASLRAAPMVDLLHVPKGRFQAQAGDKIAMLPVDYVGGLCDSLTMTGDDQPENQNRRCLEIQYRRVIFTGNTYLRVNSPSAPMYTSTPR